MNRGAPLARELERLLEVERRDPGPAPEALDRVLLRLEAAACFPPAARTAVVRGKAPDALGALQEHRVRFPNGRLLEEREALRVQALVFDLQWDAARAEGAQFLNRFPQSLLRPMVEKTLQSIP